MMLLFSIKRKQNLLSFFHIAVLGKFRKYTDISQRVKRFFMKALETEISINFIKTKRDIFLFHLDCRKKNPLETTELFINFGQEHHRSICNSGSVYSPFLTGLYRLPPPDSAVSLQSSVGFVGHGKVRG